MKLFKKRNWSNWQHVLFLEHFQAGIPTTELMKRTCKDSGLNQYKEVKISKTVHNLSSSLKNQLTAK
jgi:hypothetical protein